MQLTENWAEIYTQSDSFRSFYNKYDLIYLINRYGKKVNGESPTKTELQKLQRKQLYHIWFKIKPFEFGKDVLQ
jgi:hypothetical protein